MIRRSALEEWTGLVSTLSNLLATYVPVSNTIKECS